MEDVATRVIIYSDSQLFAQKLNGFYEVKEESLLRYLKNVREVVEHFKDLSTEQIPREENAEADSSLAGEGREILNYTKLVASIDTTPITPQKTNG